MYVVVLNLVYLNRSNLNIQLEKKKEKKTLFSTMKILY